MCLGSYKWLMVVILTAVSSTARMFSIHEA